jgi:hypothetical protein
MGRAGLVAMAKTPPFWINRKVGSLKFGRVRNRNESGRRFAKSIQAEYSVESGAAMRTQSEDTDLQAEKMQLDLLRRATLERRVAAAVSLSKTAIQLATKAIRRQNPSLGDREVLLRFVEIHHGSELAGRLRIDLSRRLK